MLQRKEMNPEEQKKYNAMKMKERREEVVEKMRRRARDLGCSSPEKLRVQYVNTEHTGAMPAKYSSRRRTEQTNKEGRTTSVSDYRPQ